MRLKRLTCRYFEALFLVLALSMRSFRISSHLLHRKLWFGRKSFAISSRLEDLIIPSDTKATLLNLIKLGDSWIEEQPERTQNINFLGIDTGHLSVPNCLAAVKLKVNVTPFIQITGKSDSKVALGMLALLSEVKCEV
jgi:hypothetical protein